MSLSDVTQAISQLLAGLLSTAAIKALGSHFKENRNESKAETMDRCVSGGTSEAMPLCAADKYSFRSASRHAGKRESVYRHVSGDL